MSKKIQKRTFKKRKESKIPKILSCPYCGEQAVIRHADYIFKENVSENAPYYYVCKNYPDCDTYIKCQMGNFLPYGTLANRKLRQMRTVAHNYITLIVENDIMEYNAVYDLLASKRDVELKYAHLRYSTMYSIKETIAILREVLDNNGIEYNYKLIEIPVPLKSSVA